MWSTYTKINLFHYHGCPLKLDHAHTYVDKTKELKLEELSKPHKKIKINWGTWNTLASRIRNVAEKRSRCLAVET